MNEKKNGMESERGKNHGEHNSEVKFFFKESYDDLMKKWRSYNGNFENRIPKSKMVFTFSIGYYDGYYDLECDKSIVATIDFPLIWMRDKFIASQTNSSLNKVWHISEEQRQRILQAKNTKKMTWNVKKEIIDNNIFSLVEIQMHNMLYIKCRYNYQITGIYDLQLQEEESNQLNFVIDY